MYSKHFSLVAKTFTVILFILPIIYTITSLLAAEGPRLPLLMKIPFFPDNGLPFFHINYTIQILIMIVGCNLVAGYELLTFFYIQVISCRMEILARMIEQWNDKIRQNHLPSDVRENNLLLEEIVRYHSSIKRDMVAFKEFFSPTIMVTLLSSSLVICACLVIISMVRNFFG